MEVSKLGLLVIGSCLVCGCGTSPPPAASGGSQQRRPQQPATEASFTSAIPAAAEPDADSAESTPAAEAVELQVLEWAGVEDLIASHRGKVVVVDLWATYCAPCIREFPGLVALNRSHPDEVACISVSLDDVDDQDKALAFLQEHEATFDNVLCTTDPDTLYDEILKVGAIPVIYVYGPDGEMLKRFTSPTEDGSEVSYEEHIVPFVVGLLGEG